MNPLAMDRRNLTPDQLALVMGRHYNRVKLPAAERARRAVAARGTSPEKQDGVKTQASYRLATLYGVGHDTIEKAGKFAAAVETLKAVDPEIEQRPHPGLSSVLSVPEQWGI